MADDLKPQAPPRAARPVERLSKRAALERRLRQTEALIALSRQVGEADALEDILDALVRLTSEIMDADRSSFFLYDPHADELFSRMAQGVHRREIRFASGEGIAGAVFHGRTPVIVDDAYADPRFNAQVDLQTSYVTRTILGVPIINGKGEVIGVAQCFNKAGDKAFTGEDAALLAEIGQMAAPALQGTQLVERIRKAGDEEKDFLNVVADITSEIELDSLLARVMAEATRMLDAERSTLFLHDEKTDTLFSRVAQGGSVGASVGEIRLPSSAGIAGAVFTSGQAINIPHAYADLRFNPSFDRQTGFFTRSILCAPVINKAGRVIGVTQALNKRGGPFTDQDESRLRAFTAQVAIGLENAKLFYDVQTMKNYTESMLLSMSNGVVSLDENNIVTTCNLAGLKILRCAAGDLVGRPADEVFAGANAWILERIAKVTADKAPDIQMDIPLAVGDQTASVNFSVLPLRSEADVHLGAMLMIEDISTEKRVKATMARYMDPTIAARMMESGDGGLLGGQSSLATVMFTDIRGFTPIAEQLGPQGTVAFLNEYFTLMVDVIAAEGGMLDKFIGDAIMAAFGLPAPHDDDEDRAVRAAIAMIKACRRFSEERTARGQLPVDMGIGLHTDMVVSGNIGSAKRMDYTLIGDGVNLASRLESACKQYSARILISEATYGRLRGVYRVRDIDKVIVKGKTQPVGVFEVLDYHTPQSFPELMEVVNYFNDGVRLYRQRDFAGAIPRFESALARHPRDRLSETYIARCRHMIDHPPPEDWAGVWTMTEK
jgi:adenylate cyclase